MQPTYTPEEQKDIETRLNAAKVYLAENGLEIAAQVLTPNLGNADPKFNNIFGFMVHPYIKDSKYSKTETSEVNQDSSNEPIAPTE